MIKIAGRRDPFNNILTCHSYHQMMSAYVPLCRGCSRMHVALVHQWLSRTLQNVPSSFVSFSRSSEPLDLCAHDQIRSSILGMLKNPSHEKVICWWWPVKGRLISLSLLNGFPFRRCNSSTSYANRAAKSCWELLICICKATEKIKWKTVRCGKEKEGRCLNWDGCLDEYGSILFVFTHVWM